MREQAVSVAMRANVKAVAVALVAAAVAPVGVDVISSAGANTVAVLWIPYRGILNEGEGSVHFTGEVCFGRCHLGRRPILTDHFWPTIFGRQH